jgi:hypothetical protein
LENDILVVEERDATTVYTCHREVTSGLSYGGDLQFEKGIVAFCCRLNDQVAFDCAAAVIPSAEEGFMVCCV